MILLLSAMLLLQQARAADPDWTRSLGRSIDGERIYYVTKAEAALKADALYKAEGLALKEAHGECSMVPKSAQIADRHTSSGQFGFTAFVRLSLDARECGEIRLNSDPDTRGGYEHAGLADQLRKFENWRETPVFLPAATAKKTGAGRPKKTGPARPIPAPSVPRKKLQ